MKNEGRVSKIAAFILVTALTIIAVLCFIAEKNYGDFYSRPLLDDKEYALVKGWEITPPPSSGNVQKNVAMPQVLDYKGDGTYTLRVVLPDLGSECPNPVILFCTNHMDITACVDSEEIYSCVTAGKGLSKTPGNIYHILALPTDYAGKTLGIRLTLLLKDSIPYTVLTPVMASRAAIISHMFKEDLASIIIVSLILLFGILLLIMGVALRKADGQWQSLVFTGFFAVLFSGYALCETEMIHLLIANTYVIYLCDFLFLALLPVPILLLLTMFAPKKLTWPLYTVIALNITSFLIQIGLNFAHVRDFREMLPLTHVVIVISMVMLVLCFYIKPKHPDAFRINFVRSMLPVVIGAVIDMCLFYIPELFSENSFFFQIGVFLFVIMQMRFAIHTYFDLHAENIQMNLYEKMAFTDALTEIGNRAAFEQRLQKLMHAKEKSMPVWCVCADINNLKWVNDTQGHSTGDTLIRDTAHILESCAGHVYRTGGDEFVFFQEKISETEMTRLIECIYRRIERYNQKHAIFLSVALGYDFLRPEDKNILDLYMRADKRMYRQKEQMKKLT